ncbi:MAG: hypothetical protein M0T73_14855 [Deltaproteobacteria bacterium]|nr:hypothetical protein [Deltaproteobacteria bacterium]
MGALTEDIARLCGEIEALRDSRKVFESQLDKETKEMKAEVSVMRGGFRQDHKTMAGRTKADRVKFVSALDAEVSGLLNAFDKSHAEMATQTKKANAAFVSDVANHVSGLLTGYHKNRKEMGATTKRENAIFVADVIRFVNAKNKETKVMMDGFKVEHVKMAKATKADRKKFVNQLENNVNAMRKVNVDDLVGARAAWATLSPQGRKVKLAAEQRARAEQERKTRMEAEQRAKALEDSRARAEAEKSRQQHESSSEKKKDKK